jgi:uncharacterized repeat protein (TIGR03803 family)
MKTTLKCLITGLTLLTLATLNLQLCTALASTNCVGVLTVAYNMNAQASGNWDDVWNWPGSPEWISHDSYQIRIHGQVQYQVLQIGTNLIIGDVLSSNATQTVSGSWEESSSYFNWQSFGAPTIIGGPNPVCVLMTNASDTATQFLGTCETPSIYIVSTNYHEGSVSYGTNSVCDGWSPDWNWPLSGYDELVGLHCLKHVMDQVRHFQFAIPDPTVPFTEYPYSTTNCDVTTNMTFDIWYSPWDCYVSVTDTDSGSAYANCSFALQYVPGTTVPFTADPTNGLVPLTVQFNCGAVDSESNAIISWLWNFGDGTTTNIQNPAHIYTEVGTNLVTLTATNINGTAVQGIGVPNITVSLPTVQFTVWPTNGVTPLTVNFTCPAVDSGGNFIVSWNWDFGDNTTFDDQSPDQPVSVNHIYTQIKKFSPKLTVINIWGTQITTNGPKVFVSAPPIFFTASPTNGLVPMRVQFGGPGKDSQNYAITNWNWYFGDGSTGSGQNPVHTYTRTCIFSPTLVVMNNHGTPIVAFGPNISVGCSAVHAFGGGGVGYDPASGGMTNSDGIHPQAELTMSSNRLYGVMSGGGNGGSGTIFAVNNDGSDFTNLYNFSAPPMMWYTNGDGEWPRARLVLSGITLYGVASSGGTGGGTSFMGEGTLFKINTDGSSFATLFNFPDGSDGGTFPNGLVLSSNTLYGTTASGGSAYNGTVFKIATDGSGFTRIHDFSASAYDPSSGSETNGDGASPQAALVLSGNTLYGTASHGGSGGQGTVFKLGTNGSGFAVLHNFTNSDGSDPSAELMLSDRMLYGTTEAGGSGNEGTVFQIGTDGTGFSTLHVFPATVSDGFGNYTNSDGAEPYGGLILSGSMLYGTTEAGGGGSGTIFAINMNGSGFTNLYNFSALDPNTRTNSDGANPYAGLALSGNTVYATTFNGGSAGYGALFSLNLGAAPPWLDIQHSGNALVISWLSSATRFTLQKNSDLETANWTTNGLTVFDDGTNKSITISPPAGNLFFRLSHPE